MTCVICKQADTDLGTATVTLERDATTLAIKDAVGAHDHDVQQPAKANMNPEITSTRPIMRAP